MGKFSPIHDDSPGWADREINKLWVAIRELRGSRRVASSPQGQLAETAVQASGINYSINPGTGNTATGTDAHAEGTSTTASGAAAHASGDESEASGDAAHAEGDRAVAAGPAAHAEGMRTTADGDNAHAEGNHSAAGGESAHAEGAFTVASGSASHAEGDFTQATGHGAHAEGTETWAIGDYSHASGWSAIAFRTGERALGQQAALGNVLQRSQISVTGNFGTDDINSNAGTSPIVIPVLDGLFEGTLDIYSSDLADKWVVTFRGSNDAVDYAGRGSGTVTIAASAGGSPPAYGSSPITWTVTGDSAGNVLFTPSATTGVNRREAFLEITELHTYLATP